VAPRGLVATVEKGPYVRDHDELLPRRYRGESYLYESVSSSSLTATLYDEQTMSDGAAESSETLSDLGARVSPFRHIRTEIYCNPSSDAIHL
jgi:hypothetical protein